MSRATAIPYVLEPPREPLRLVTDGTRESEGAGPELRSAAMRADGARKAMLGSDADQALRLWEGLLSGGWTLVDWFDSDGRRFILAKRSQTHPASRGLTTREREVALCAALGESSKATSYRLGISPSRVSTLLRAVMAKLGVRTKAQLVIMVRALRCQIESGSLSPAILESNG